MQCEFSDGTFWTVTNEEDLESKMNQVGVDEHVILSDDEGFIQVARGASGVELQWSDGTTLYECADDLNFAHTVPLFVAFFRKEAELRTLVKWRPMETHSADSESAGSAGNRRSGWSWTGSEEHEFQQDPAQFLKKKAKGFLKRKLKDLMG